MNEDPEREGHYWAKLDYGEGNISREWEPAIFDGKSWWVVLFIYHPPRLEIAYVAEVGKEIRPGEEP